MHFLKCLFKYITPDSGGQKRLLTVTVHVEERPVYYEAGSEGYLTRLPKFEVIFFLTSFCKFSILGDILSLLSLLSVVLIYVFLKSITLIFYDLHCIQPNYLNFFYFHLKKIFIPH